MSNEIVPNQHGEQTDLAVPENFGTGLSFMNPSDIPDLDRAEVGFNIQPESVEFKTVGENIRAVFNGFTNFRVKDQANPGQYLDKRTAVLQTKNGIKINMGANLIKQLEMVPVGTAIQITFKGEEKTNSGNKVKMYEVMTLNVQRTAIPARAAPVTVEPKHDYATEFWKYVNENGIDEAIAKEFIRNNDNDFKKALAELAFQ